MTNGGPDVISCPPPVTGYVGLICTVYAPMSGGAVKVTGSMKLTRGRGEFVEFADIPLDSDVVVHLA